MSCPDLARIRVSEWEHAEQRTEQSYYAYFTKYYLVARSSTHIGSTRVIIRYNHFLEKEGGYIPLNSEQNA